MPDMQAPIRAGAGMTRILHAITLTLGALVLALVAIQEASILVDRFFSDDEYADDDDVIELDAEEPLPMPVSGTSAADTTLALPGNRVQRKVAPIYGTVFSNKDIYTIRGGMPVPIADAMRGCAAVLWDGAERLELVPVDDLEVLG